MNLALQLTANAQLSANGTRKMGVSICSAKPSEDEFRIINAALAM
jgi:hypothetical protein